MCFRDNFWHFFGLVAGVLLLTSCSFESMFYHPTRECSFSFDTSGTHYRYIQIPTVKDQYIQGLWAIPDSTPVANILFLHGNAGNLTDRYQSIEILRKHGFRVLIFDYRGFGQSKGTVSHQHLIEDAEAAFRYLNARKLSMPIIVFGRSIGGHLAVNLCSMHQDSIEAMVIEGAFTSHNRIAQAVSPWWLSPFAAVFVKSSYQARKLISGVKIPKLIVHSTEDEVVPYYMGLELYNKSAKPAEFWEIKGKHIGGLGLYEDLYIQKIRDLIK